MRFILKTPSAWIPLAMSATAIALLVSSLLIFGVRHETDEGTAAHLFQILLAGQLPLVAYFAIKWLPQNLKQGFLILALQACFGLIALAPVFYFKL